ncbi:hypothetical protein BDV93DRAFT_437436 [Ceratobasidium sp. AG-I]|nr:hypothetical protein BDV93DRAFT_437436 [Ceratobasidium sp. AG-I]
MQTGDRTQNLLGSAIMCDKHSGTQSDLTLSLLPVTSGEVYSAAKHKAIIALRCAQNKRPFNSIADELYKQEVELLHLGTSIPTPQTVSHDIYTIYAGAADGVKNYFNVRACSSILYFSRY